MSFGAPPPSEQVEVDVHLEGRHRHYWQKTDIAASPAGAVTASRQVLRGDVRALVGWSVAETTGTAAAAFRLRDGTGTTSEVLARINLAANESDRDTFGQRGILVNTGNIWLEFISGSFEGVVYWI